MQVTIKYSDDTAFTVEEVVKQAVHNYGKRAIVEVLPDSSKPHDLIYFALQCMVTHIQLSLLYDDKFGYAKSLQTLRSETLYKLGELLDQVLIDNEAKVA
jgi:hypothetical protein